MFTGKIDFKKVDLKVSNRGGGYRNKRSVYMQGRKGEYGKTIYNRLCITADLVEETGFKPKDRVDLLQCGNMFALQKSSVGILTLNAYAHGGKSLVIGNVDLCAHLRATTNGCIKYDAWVDDGMIIFKPKETV